MLGWIKDKVVAGLQEMSNARAGEELRAQFTPIEKLPGAPARLANRLARYVLLGEGEGVVAELTALPGTNQALDMSALHYWGTSRGNLAESLSKIVNLLPQAPEIYLRLALVYEAALHAGTGAAFYV